MLSRKWKKGSKNFLLVSVVFVTQQEIKSLILGKVISEGITAVRVKVFRVFQHVTCNTSKSSSCSRLS